ALGRVPLFRLVRGARADARIVVVTREDLREGFELTDAVDIVIVPGLVRGAPLDLRDAAAKLGVDLGRAAAVFADPDPDRWIRHHCRALVAPDSGVLSIVYYLDAVFDLLLVSLWSDPDQGVMKQSTPSPNARLVHVPLAGRQRNVANIAPDEVARVIVAALAH